MKISLFIRSNKSLIDIPSRDITDIINRGEMCLTTASTGIQKQHKDPIPT